jgi:hypothetical protein
MMAKFAYRTSDGTVQRNVLKKEGGNGVAVAGGVRYFELPGGGTEAGSYTPTIQAFALTGRFCPGVNRLKILSWNTHKTSYHASLLQFHYPIPTIHFL